MSSKEKNWTSESIKHEIDRSEVKKMYEKEVEVLSVWSNYTFDEYLEQIKRVYTVIDGGGSRV